ncbi:MAG TPA: hypothetical protein VFZ47_10820, partial [Chitinophagaceae bacterium]
MFKNCLLVTMLSFQVLLLTAQNNPADSFARKKYFTQRINGTITLDGIPNEDAWNGVDWGGNFTQWMPHEGKPPSQETNFKILYDNKFLYIAYRAHDLSPDSIVKFMGRRDEFPG